MALSEMHKNALMSVLKDLKGQAMGAMGEDVKGYKKVTVAAPDDKSLAAGLDTAKEVVGDAGEGEKESLVAGVDVDALSPEDCDALLKALQAKKMGSEE